MRFQTRNLPARNTWTGQYWGSRQQTDNSAVLKLILKTRRRLTRAGPDVNRVRCD